MTPLAWCLAAQREALSRIPEHPRGAWLGVSDCVAEEVLVREEMGRNERSYEQFLQSKQIAAQSVGFTAASVSDALFPFQRDVVSWALQRGRAAMFEDCGLGKTAQQLEWARHVCAHTASPVLILAPLAVSQQTVREGRKFGIDVAVAHQQSDIRDGLHVTNYEKLHHFDDPSVFGGVVLDESSILKGFDGKLRKRITDFARQISFRLACSATPAPNDYMELGNHAEFLDVMSTSEMLATFFVHDGGDTSKWRLKGHATDAFWKWVASWAVCIRKPGDLGYEDGRFILPALRMKQHTVESRTLPGMLFAAEAKTLGERRDARRDSIEARVAACADLVNGSDDQWIVWCNLNAESEALFYAIKDSVQVVGADSPEFKEKTLVDFAEGRLRVLITKPTIAGFGLNFQNCARMAFVGLSDSYEQIYQAVRRCWRFGQTREVECHVITSEAEGEVVRNIERKEKQSEAMAAGMVEYMRDLCRANVRGAARERDSYVAGKRMSLPSWIGGAA